MKIRDLFEGKEPKKIPPSKPRDPNTKTLQSIRSSGAAGAHKDKKKAMKQGDVKHKGKIMAEDGLDEFAPAGSNGNVPPRGPKTPGKDPWGGNDAGEDPYSKPVPEYYSRSIDFFGRFEADHFDDEEFNEKTGEFKGYWDDEEGRVQIAYFKFSDPKKTGDDDPGMGWYYEPQDGSLAEYGDTKKGQKMLTKVQKRAVDRMIKADDNRDAKAAKKNQQSANRAWDRMTDKD